jgi:hypothetical protein
MSSCMSMREEQAANIKHFDCVGLPMCAPSSKASNPAAGCSCQGITELPRESGAWSLSQPDCAVGQEKGKKARQRQASSSRSSRPPYSPTAPHSWLKT